MELAGYPFLWRASVTCFSSSTRLTSDNERISALCISVLMTALLCVAGWWDHRKGVIYSIPCAKCPQTYIGLTGRSLDHRLSKHHRALKNGDVAASVAEHVFSSNHEVDLSKATVIDAHAHTQTCCMLESWHIRRHQATLNRGKGICLKPTHHC